MTNSIHKKTIYNLSDAESYIIKGYKSWCKSAKFHSERETHNGLFEYSLTMAEQLKKRIINSDLQHLL